MKAVILVSAMVFFTQNLWAQGQGSDTPASPQAPLLKEVAACFQTLPLNRRSKSKMQFYSEIVKSNGPNCFPLMLIVKDDSGRVPKLSVYRDNPNGQIEGLHTTLLPRWVGDSNYVKIGLPNGREDVTYSCQFTSEENIAQYGEQKSRRPLVVNIKSHPPTIYSEPDSSTVSPKSIQSDYGYDERILLRQIRTEIALRSKEMGSNARIYRDQFGGLESCLGLMMSRSKERDGSKNEFAETEALLKKWLGQNKSMPHSHGATDKGQR